MSVLTGPWSYSRATSCARSLYMEKVLKAPPEPRLEGFLEVDRRSLGSVLHLGAERMLKSVVGGGKWPDPEAMARECVEVEERGQRPYFHMAPSIPDIAESLEKFADRFQCDWNMDKAERDVLLRECMLGSEMRLAVDGQGKICSFEKCPADGWRGIVDYAQAHEDTLTVIDFKNRPAIFPKSELMRDEQLSGYLHLAMSHFPGQYKHLRMGIYYFEFGHTQVVDVDEEVVEANVARLRERARAKEGMAKDDIGPEPGFGKCQYCSYISSCPIDVFGDGELAPMDLEQVRSCARRRLVERERLILGMSALQTFTAEHGPVELDDKTMFGHSLSDTSVSYDKNLTLRILNQLIEEGKIEGKLSDFTSLDTRAVKRVAKDEAVAEALAPATSPKVDTKFDFFKPTSRRGVRKVKEGRKMVVHPQDRKTKEKVKR